MFGSLVIVFPTAHEGGALVLRHHGQEWIFDSAAILSECAQPSLAYIAFYSDVEHEIMPIKSGYRITVTYNLYFGNTPNPSPDTSGTASIPESTFQAALKEILADSSFLPSGGLLGFGLRHEYPLPLPVTSEDTGITEKRPLDSLLEFLKGSDAIVKEACQALGPKVSLRIVYDVDDEMIMFRNIINLDGHYIGQESTSYILRQWYGGIGLKYTPKPGGDSAEDTNDHPVEDAVVDDHAAKTVEDDNQSANDDEWNGPDSDAEHEGSYYRRKEKKPVKVHWVTPLTTLNEFKERFIVYGNEPVLDSAYGHVCLIAKLPPTKLREPVENTD